MTKLGSPAQKPEQSDGLGPSAAEVRAFLERNPDFLRQNPDLAAIVTAPERPRGDGIVDMQQFLVERLREENEVLKVTQQEMIENARSNMYHQTRVNEAVLTLMGAPSFAHLIHAITNDFAIILDMDVVSLSIENAELNMPGQELSGVQILAAGEIDRRIGKGKRFRLEQARPDDADLYGGLAGLVQSQALVRLIFSPETPQGILAFGSRKEDAFDESMGTDLLNFIGKSIEALVRQWLDLPAR